MNAKKNEAIAFLQSLLQIDSVNPPGNELYVVEKVVERANQCGLDTEVMTLSENRANVIVTLKSQRKMSEKAPSLIFSGHLDTVPVGNVPWKHNPFSGEISDSKIFGIGSSDMKSGVAAMIEAMIMLKSKGVDFDGDLVFVGTAGEEVDCLGASAVIKENILDNAGAIVIGEPSNGKIFTAHKGVLWLKFETFGKTAHCSMPENGINALMHMNELINQIKEYQFNYKEHHLLGKPTLTISTIEGGVSTNVIPDKCIATADIRTIPGMNHEEIVKDIRTIIERLESHITNFQSRVTVLHDLNPIECTRGDAFVQLALEVNKEISGVDCEEKGVNYYTDGSIFSLATNIPIIIYGPGDENLAHQPDEHVSINKYMEAINYYAKLAERYFQSTKEVTAEKSELNV
ncbi:M20 family metallopeptidase [Siminovitchia sediminis]|uniref:M20 family metallopeptidase n=1 Tax=Siminovitchia sediminis TaxID=1274353 RepID=A0ABW4KI87_9BACI